MYSFQINIDHANRSWVVGYFSEDACHGHHVQPNSRSSSIIFTIDTSFVYNSSWLESPKLPVSAGPPIPNAYESYQRESTAALVLNCAYRGGGGHRCAQKGRYVLHLVVDQQATVIQIQRLLKTEVNICIQPPVPMHQELRKNHNTMTLFGP
jgi:hypothetical protein